MYMYVHNEMIYSISGPFWAFHTTLAFYNCSTNLIRALSSFVITLFIYVVSYLMYGPFGSFAPAYDTAFATLTKHDSSLLLSTYGSELGINYANRYISMICSNF